MNLDKIQGIYLGGPIRWTLEDGCYPADKAWRTEVKESLPDLGIYATCFDPILKNKNILDRAQKEGRITANSTEAIFRNNVEILNLCDVAIFNLLGFGTTLVYPGTNIPYPSCGSLWEIGYLNGRKEIFDKYGHRDNPKMKPIDVIIITDNASIVHNPMFHNCWFVDSIQELFLFLGDFQLGSEEQKERTESTLAPGRPRRINRTTVGRPLSSLPDLPREQLEGRDIPVSIETIPTPGLSDEALLLGRYPYEVVADANQQQAEILDDLLDRVLDNGLTDGVICEENVEYNVNEGYYD